MDRKKLIRAFKIVLFLLVVLLIIAFIILPMFKDNGVALKQDEGGISTDVTFHASNYDGGKLVQDYSKPTEQEKLNMDNIYGRDNAYFDEEGLHVVDMTDVVEGSEDMLITDKWPDNEMTRSVLKPELDILKVEVGETYLYISVQNVTKKDLQRYIKAINDEFKNEATKLHPKTIFRARNDQNVTVDIKFFKDTSKGTIEYYF